MGSRNSLIPGASARVFCPSSSHPPPPHTQVGDAGSTPSVDQGLCALSYPVSAPASALAGSPSPSGPRLTRDHWSHAEQGSPCSCRGSLRGVKGPPWVPLKLSLCGSLRSPLLRCPELSHFSAVAPMAMAGAQAGGGQVPCPGSECAVSQTAGLTRGMGVCTRFLTVKSPSASCAYSPKCVHPWLLRSSANPGRAARLVP